MYIFILFPCGLNNLTIYERRHFKLFTNYHVSSDTLYMQGNIAYIWACYAFRNYVVTRQSLYVQKLQDNYCLQYHFLTEFKASDFFNCHCVIFNWFFFKTTIFLIFKFLEKNTPFRLKEMDVNMIFFTQDPLGVEFKLYGEEPKVRVQLRGLDNCSGYITLL